jgi:hypothetical protein
MFRLSSIRNRPSKLSGINAIGEVRPEEKVMVDPVQALFTARRKIPWSGFDKLSAVVLFTSGLLVQPVVTTVNVAESMPSDAVTVNEPGVLLAVN